MYKLIAHPPPDGITPTPFYGYDIKDENGKKIDYVTKVTITIDPDEYVYPMMTFKRKWLENENMIEETIENVPVDIRVEKFTEND